MNTSMIILGYIVILLPSLSLGQKNLEAVPQRNRSMYAQKHEQLLISALFIKAKDWKQP